MLITLDKTSRVSPTHILLGPFRHLRSILVAANILGCRGVNLFELGVTH